MQGTQSLRWIYGVVVLGGIALVAYLQALGANRLVEAALMVPMLQPPTRPPPEAADISSPPAPAPPPLPEIRATGIPELRWMDAPECAGFELSTVSQAADPRASLATVRRAGEPAGRLLRRGSQLDGLQMLRVGYDARGVTPAVWFVRDESLCQLRMFSRSDAAAAPAKQTAVAVPVEQAPAPSPSEIRSLGPGSFQVDQSLVDRLMADPKAARDAQAAFERTPAGTFALKFRRVRPGGWAHAIGLQAGDRLTSINGYELKDPRHAIEAYAALRMTKDLVLKVERSGTTETIQVAIR